MIEEIPSATQLLQSVAAFLDSEVAPALKQSDLKFKLRVATNILAIIEREVATGAAAAAAEVRTLQGLVDSEAGSLAELRGCLAEEIQSGRFDSDLIPLASQLLPGVCDRMGIDNPRYSTLVELQQPNQAGSTGE